MEPFERAVGKKALGNKPASGTEIIQELGAAHLESGRPIVYTSADSVFQIAAHEEVVPREQLYQWCRIAREILQGPHAVGRVIARPFVGSPGQFRRTGGRRDFSLSPPAPTILDRAREAGFPVAVTGKVADIFNHRGISRQEPGSGNEETAASLFRLVEELESGLIWATFGDFDTLYGHRNDRRGFAAALERFDEHLSCLLERLREEDLLIITADHGCDPQHPGTDHTREYVPLMATGRRFRNRVDLGTGSSLADVGAGAARWLGLDPPPQGSSFLDYADLG
jgi:phosphopentomutase